MHKKDLEYKKIIFFVQGEGRGHLMQAIGLKEALKNSSAEIVKVVVGKSYKKIIPDFFKKSFPCEVLELTSPCFIYKKNNRGINITASVFNLLKNLPVFLKNIKTIKKLITNDSPDIIINFYEPLISVYSLFSKNNKKYYCIGHQYIFLHNKFKFPKGFYFYQLIIKYYTKFTCLRAHQIFALSFYPLPIEGKLITVPPIIRKDIKEKKSKKENFILIYLSNFGFITQIIDWHKQFPEVVIHCFTDKSKAEFFNYSNKNFHLNEINDLEFANKLANCNCLCTTAGFESVCEAMYLGKPVLMIPMENHYEQFCNSRDAYFAGAGIYDNKFNLSKLIDFANIHSENSTFKHWVNQNEFLMLNSLLK